MKSPGWMIVIAILMIAAGCAPTEHVRRERTLSAEEVLRQVRARDGSIATLRGEGTITIESPDQSASVGFDLRLKKPDSVRVEFSGPFGMRVGTLMLARTNFVYYSYLDNKAVTGTPDGSTLGAMFHLTLEFDEILRAFTGDFLSWSAGDSLERFTVESDNYLLVYRRADGRREYRIDADAFVVSSYRLLDSTGKPVVTAFASDVDTDGTIPMPKLLRIIFPHERRSITVAYDDVHFNEQVQCAFRLPRHAEILNR